MRIARVRVKARFEEKCFFFYFRLVLIENLGSWYNLYWLVKEGHS